MLRANCVLPQPPADCTTYVDELRQIAREVRRIGCGYRTDPESISMVKSDIALRLVTLARELERRK